MTPITFLVEARQAIFTDPLFKGERFSYPIPTPSALAGVLGAVFWKPEMRWDIHWAEILKPIRRYTIMTNELTFLPISSRSCDPIYTEEKGTQRVSSVLHDVAYRFSASISVSEIGLKDPVRNNLAKYEAMFQKYWKHGHHVRCPYLGVKEYLVDNLEIAGSKDPLPVEETFDVGPMHYGRIRSGRKAKNYFFNARLINGRIDYPNWTEVIESGKYVE